MTATKPTILLDLASEVLLFVTTFRRQAKRGSAMTGSAVQDEVKKLFLELDQAAQREPGLAPAWEPARRTLVFLVDEVMCSTEWEYRGWWGDHTLEMGLLNNPQKMRGILFFDDLEKLKTQVAGGTTTSDADRRWQLDLLTIFYCCLRFGFEGKYVGQAGELSREADAVYALLPVTRKQQARACFPQAYEHTIEVPPNYQTVMRLATLAAIVVGAVILFVVFRQVLWNDLLQDLDTATQQAGAFFSGDRA